MTNMCQHRTLKGGHGVDDARGVREWMCALPEGHTGACDYSREVGGPSTVTSASDASRRGLDIHGVREVMKRFDETASPAALEALPMGVLDDVQRRIRVIRDLLDAFGPRREIIALTEEIIKEIERWA